MNPKPVSFRIPSKYLVFLESLAGDNGTDRTKELITILDQRLQLYLKQPRAAQQPQPCKSPQTTRQPSRSYR